MYYKMFSDISGLYILDASSVLHMTAKNVPRHGQVSSWKSPHLRTIAIYVHVDRDVQI